MKYCILSEHTVPSHLKYSELQTRRWRRPGRRKLYLNRIRRLTWQRAPVIQAEEQRRRVVPLPLLIRVLAQLSVWRQLSGPLIEGVERGLQHLSAPLAEICVVCQDRTVAVALDCGHEFCGHCPAGWQGYCQSLSCPLCRQPSRSQTLLAGVDPDDVLPLRRLSQTPPPPPGDETFPTAFSDENWEVEAQAQPLRHLRGDC